MAPRLLDRLQRVRRAVLVRARGDTLMLVLAAAVGLGTGLLAVALIATVRSVQRLAFGAEPGAATILLAPTIGAFLVGMLLRYVAPESSGSGIVQIMRTIALRAGRFRGRVPFAGVAATGLALGTGASGGREGPIVLIGGSFGSLVGRFFAVGEERMRTLVAAGAAAGIGASFNAPIGGMLFAIELIVGGFRAASLQVIVVASVVGSVTARELVGSAIIYRPETIYTLGDPRELLLYVLLGLLAAGFGVLFLQTEYRTKRFFTRMPAPRPVKLALGGFGVGLIALAIPEVLGTGDNLPPIDGVREPIQAMLDGDFAQGYQAVGILLLLAVAKLAATSLSVGSGNAVGTFAPAIFCGAALGGALGHVAEMLLPAADVQSGAFALVGMAAVFSGVARAPLTAILIAFELTDDYELVLPLMLATGIATFVADRLHPESVYTLPLRDEGIVYAEPEDIDIMQTVKVSEIMTADPDTLPADLPLSGVIDTFGTTRHHGFPVVDGNRLVGVLTLSDLGRTGPDGRREELTAGDLCTREPLTVTPNDPVFRALRRMASLDIGRLPVVADDDHSRLVGLVRRSDVVKAYQRAVTRSLGVQQHRETRRLRDLAGARFIELVVDPEAEVAGRVVREVAWPQRTILTSIRRHGELIMPHGDTVLEPEDTVVALTGQDAAAELRDLFGRHEREPGAEI